MSLNLITTRYQKVQMVSSAHPRLLSALVTTTLCGVILMLGGCVSGSASIPRTQYTLGTAQPITSGGGRTTSHGDHVIRLARIRAAPWLAGTDMFYRLAYRDGNRLMAYAYSDWSATPTALLAPIIRSTLAEHGNWQAVVGPGNPAAAGFTLHVRLEHFVQIFKHPDRSIGVIAATATLLHDTQLVGQKHFRVAVPAKSADAQGGAQALSQAARTFALHLQRWVQARARTAQS